jgi:hypothetical protein
MQGLSGLALGVGFAVKKFCFFWAVCLCASSIGAIGEVKDTDLKEYLAGVTDRGQALYAYDQAAWHGTDAIPMEKLNSQSFAAKRDLHHAMMQRSLTNQQNEGALRSPVRYAPSKNP